MLLLGIQLPLLALIFHAIVHDSAFALLRSDNLACPVVTLGLLLLIFLFVDSSASILDPCGLSSLLLRHFLVLIVLVVFTALAASLGDLIALLLDLVGLLTFVAWWSWLSALASDAA